MTENTKKNKQADDALKNTAEELRALNGLSRRLIDNLSLDGIVQITFDEINKCIALDLVLLFLRSGEELVLQGMQARSSDLHYSESQIKKAGECLCGLSMSEEKPQYSEDIYNDPRCTLEDCRKAGMHSFAAIPLRKGNQIIGVLGIAGKTHQDFSQRAVFLDTVSSNISIAIQNILQYKEAEQSATELEEQVTERMRAELAQREIERRQALIIRTMQLVLYCAVTPSPFGATWMTENVEKVTGFPAKLFLEEPGFWSSRIHPDDLRRVERAFELIRIKKVMDLEYRWKCANGSYRWFLDHIVSIQKESGEAIEYFGIWLDITLRKRQEEALRRSEERFRALFEQAAVGVAQVDTASGRFLRVNQRFSDILEYNRKELEEMDMQSITHPDDLQSDLDNMKLLIAGKIKEYSVEKRYLRKGGRTVWVSLTVSPLWAPGKPPVSHIVVVQDIANRKQAEEALKISEVRYRRLFETAREGILILDANTGQICDSNPYMETMLGYSRMELFGKALWEIGLFQDAGSNTFVFKELLKKEYIRYEKLPLVTKEGLYKSAEFIGSVYMVDNWKVIQCNIREIMG